jgi:predicted transcriptional regulator
MQHLIGIDQIIARAEAIGIRPKRLARMAGVDPATVYRGRKGQNNPRLGTVRELLETLERQEDRVRRHLKELERSGGGRQVDIFSIKGNGK